jgi:integrase
VSRQDFARRYGAFLGFLERHHRLDREADAVAQVTSPNVANYVGELQSRVRSVTVWNCVYKLRRAAELLAPAADFSWLAEIEKDLASVMEPRSKMDRLVLSEVLLEAGLTLIREAETFATSELARAHGVRDGLMIAILAVNPMRLKNFAALEVGRTLQELNGAWWVILPRKSTKTNKPDERRIPDYLNALVDRYVKHHRLVLARSQQVPKGLWLSSTDGRPMYWKSVGTLVSKLTLKTVGVDVSPHLFRTSAASTSAVHAGAQPHLASAVLGHTDFRVTEENYNRATSMTAAQAYAAITESYLRKDR